jgi:DNA polymerase III delta subunit
MIIFLYGDNDYLRQNKKQEIILKSQIKNNGFKPRVFDMENENAIYDFKDFITNQPIFDISKSAVIENLYLADATLLSKLLKSIVDDENIRVLISEEKAPTKNLNFLVKEPTRFFEFKKFSSRNFINFIKEEANSMNISINDEAVRFLSDVYNGDSWGVHTELQKLSSFKNHISKEDLNKLNLSVAPDYWFAINGLKSQVFKNRIIAMEKIFSINEAPAKTFNILASQVKNKSEVMAKYDLMAKSGLLEYDEILIDFALSYV